MNELLLSKSIYDSASIQRGVIAFRSLCKIVLTENGNYCICRFSGCVYSMNETKQEFENYVIDVMNTSTIEK